MRYLHGMARSFSASFRKYLRKEKARIRRDVFDTKEAEQKIQKLIRDAKERQSTKKKAA